MERESLNLCDTRATIEENLNSIKNWSKNISSRFSKLAEGILGKDAPMVFKDACKLNKVNMPFETVNDKGAGKSKNGKGEINQGDNTKAANHLGPMDLLDPKTLVDQEKMQTCPKELGSLNHA